MFPLASPLFPFPPSSSSPPSSLPHFAKTGIEIGTRDEVALDVEHTGCACKSNSYVSQNIHRKSSIGKFKCYNLQNMKREEKSKRRRPGGGKGEGGEREEGSN